MKRTVSERDANIRDYSDGPNSGLNGVEFSSQPKRLKSVDSHGKEPSSSESTTILPKDAQLPRVTGAGTVLSIKLENFMVTQCRQSR